MHPTHDLVDMSKLERELTPLGFAQYLVGQVMCRTGSPKVTVLYANMASFYREMLNVEVWPVLAQFYVGPYPVICHPPCGPWGKFKWRCKHQDASLGPLAIKQAHRFGGVVEQPLGSTLFRDHGWIGSTVTRVKQCDYGHRAEKATLLYWTV
jgi:hypothetical protein